MTNISAALFPSRSNSTTFSGVVFLVSLGGTRRLLAAVAVMSSPRVEVLRHVDGEQAGNVIRGSRTR